MDSAINKKSKNISIIVVFFIILFIGLTIKSSNLKKSIDDEIEEEVLEYENYDQIHQDYIVDDFYG
jgi:hypothetical protein